MQRGWHRLSAMFLPGSYSEEPSSSSKRSKSTRSKSPRPSEPVVEMPPDRRRDAPVREGSVTSAKKKYEERSKRSHDSGKVNSHELWMDTRSSKDARKAKDKDKDKDKSLLKENTTLSAEIKQLQDELRGSLDREQHLQIKCKKQEDESQEMKARFRQQDDRIATLTARMKSAADEASQQIQDLQTKNQHLDGQLRRMQELLQHTETKQSQTTALLDVRTAELKGAQTFLTKADSYSGGDIIRMLEALNSEVFQCSAYVAETIMAEPQMAEDPQLIAVCKKEVADRIGSQIVEIMTKNLATGRDPLPLQTALQMTLNSWCVNMTVTFDLDNREFDKRLTYVYEQICAKEEAAVAGRWRAMTMAQLKVFNVSRISQMLDAIYRVMIASGWCRRSRQRDSVISTIQARLMTIENSVYSLKQAVCEGVTSVDVVPMSWKSGHPYDPSVMENLYPEDEATEKGELIAGTTDMGLRRTVTSRLADGTVHKRHETLLKPKVILLSTLEDLAEVASRTMESPNVSATRRLR